MVGSRFLVALHARADELDYLGCAHGTLHLLAGRKLQHADVGI